MPFLPDEEILPKKPSSFIPDPPITKSFIPDQQDVADYAINKYVTPTFDKINEIGDEVKRTGNLLGAGANAVAELAVRPFQPLIGQQQRSFKEIGEPVKQAGEKFDTEGTPNLDAIAGVALVAMYGKEAIDLVKQLPQAYKEYLLKMSMRVASQKARAAGKPVPDISTPYHPDLQIALAANRSTLKKEMARFDKVYRREILEKATEKPITIAGLLPGKAPAPVPPPITPSFVPDVPVAPEGAVIVPPYVPTVAPAPVSQVIVPEVTGAINETTIPTVGVSQIEGQTPVPALEDNRPVMTKAIEKAKSKAAEIGIKIESVDSFDSPKYFNTKEPGAREYLRNEYKLSDEVLDNVFSGKSRIIIRGEQEVFNNSEGRPARSRIRLYKGADPATVYHEGGHAIDDQGGLWGWAGSPEEHANYLADVFLKGEESTISELTKEGSRIVDYAKLPDYREITTRTGSIIESKPTTSINKGVTKYSIRVMSEGKDVDVPMVSDKLMDGKLLSSSDIRSWVSSAKNNGVSDKAIAKGKESLIEYNKAKKFGSTMILPTSNPGVVIREGVLNTPAITGARRERLDKVLYPDIQSGKGVSETGALLEGGSERTGIPKEIRGLPPHVFLNIPITQARLSSARPKDLTYPVVVTGNPHIVNFRRPHPSWDESIKVVRVKPVYNGSPAATKAVVDAINYAKEIGAKILVTTFRAKQPWTLARFTNIVPTDTTHPEFSKYWKPNPNPRPIDLRKSPDWTPYIPKGTFVQEAFDANGWKTEKATFGEGGTWRWPVSKELDPQIKKAIGNTKLEYCDLLHKGCPACRNCQKLTFPEAAGNPIVGVTDEPFCEHGCPQCFVRLGQSGVGGRKGISFGQNAKQGGFGEADLGDTYSNTINAIQTAARNTKRRGTIDFVAPFFKLSQDDKMDMMMSLYMDGAISEQEFIASQNEIMDANSDVQSSIKHKLDIEEVVSPITQDDLPDNEKQALDAYEKQKDIWIGNTDYRVHETQLQKQSFQQELLGTLGLTKYNDIAKDYDKAIQIYIDSKRNPAHGLQFRPMLNDEQKRIFDLSQSLPPEIQAIADKMSEAYRAIGLEAQDKDIIRNVLDNYVGRIWDIKGKPGSQKYRKFGTKSRHAKPRVFDTIIQGQAAGYNLKVNGATNNLQILQEEMIKTIEDKRFMGVLKKLKTIDGDPLISHKQLDGYVPIEHPNFTEWKYAGKAENADAMGRNFFVDKDGNIFEKKIMYAPKEYASNLNNMLGVSKLRGIWPVDKITKYNAIFKSWILQSSFFHHLAFMRSYYLGTNEKKWGDMNPRQAYRSGLEAVKQESPIIELGIRNGLTLGLKQDWEESLLEEDTLIGKIIDKIPGGKPVKDKILELRKRQADFLFGELGAGLKAKAFMLGYAELQRKRPDMPADDVAKIVANLINDDFGGLHLKRIGRNPTVQHLFRIFALAPDWTESNVRSMVKAFSHTGKDGDKTEQEFYRRFWAGIITKGVAMTVLANYLMAVADDEDATNKTAYQKFLRNYKRAWKEGRLFWTSVDITPIYKATGGKTKERKYFSILGHFTDPLKFMLHPVRSAHHKGSVAYGSLYELFSGKDWAGRSFTPAKDLFKTGETVKWRPGGGPVDYETAPSYALSQLKGSQPVQIQNLISWMNGEMEGFDAIGNSLGLGVRSTYSSKSKKKSKAPRAPRRKRVSTSR